MAQSFCVTVIFILNSQIPGESYTPKEKLYFQILGLD